MRAKSIKIIHYNRQKEEIDISSPDNRDKLEAAVLKVINRTVEIYGTGRSI